MLYLGNFSISVAYRYLDLVANYQAMVSHHKLDNLHIPLVQMHNIIKANGKCSKMLNTFSLSVLK